MYFEYKISLHSLLWVNGMLNFICMSFAELLAMRSKRKFKMKIYASTGNPTSVPSLFQRGATNHSATPTVHDMLLKLLHYFGISINRFANAVIYIRYYEFLVSNTYQNPIQTVYTIIPNLDILDIMKYVLID